MKKYYQLSIIALLIGFGAITVFLSSSVIFDFFGIRAKEGNYVLFVVWANFLSGLLYGLAAYAINKRATWATCILPVAGFILLAAFVGLLLHANNGGLYEAKTIYAMAFRTVFTFGLAAATVLILPKISKSN